MFQGAGQGGRQSCRPTTVKASLTRMTWFQVFIWPFPPGITVEGATPKRGGKVVDFSVHHLPLPVAHQR